MRNYNYISRPDNCFLVGIKVLRLFSCVLNGSNWPFSTDRHEQKAASSGHSTQLDNTPPTVHHDARHPSAVAQVPEVQSPTSRVRFVPGPLLANEPVEMEVTLCSNVANWFQS